MKNAEDWESIFNQQYGLAIASVKRIRAIQLDALREAIPLIEKIGTTGVERTDIILKAEKWLSRIRELEAETKSK